MPGKIRNRHSLKHNMIGMPHNLSLKTPSSIQCVSIYFYIVPTTTLDPLTIRRIKAKAVGLHNNITSCYFTLSQITRSNIQSQISNNAFIKPTERITQTIHAAHTNLIHDELNKLARHFEHVRTRECRLQSNNPSNEHTRSCRR